MSRIDPVYTRPQVDALVETLAGTYIQPPLKSTADSIDAAALPSVNVLDFGASPDDDAADNSVAINAAIDAALADARFSHGVAVVLPSRRFRISNPILLKTGVVLYAPHGALIELNPTASCRMITNPGASTANTLPTQVTDCGIVGVTLDGSRGAGDARSPASWHAIFLKNVVRLTLQDVTVKRPLAFGGLLANCSDVYVGNYRVESDQINQDGLHFFDSEIVTINGIHGTSGDDLLGISAEYGDVRDFTVNDVVGSAVATGSIIRVNQTDRSVAAGETRTIERMRFRNIIGRASGNKGFQINDVHSSSTVRYIDLEGTFVGTPRSGLDIVRASNSRFDVTCVGCGTGVGISTSLTLQPVLIAFGSDIELTARVYGVTDGYDAIHLSAGEGFRVTPVVYYPTAGFASPQMCVWLGTVTDSSIFNGLIDGGLRGIQIGTSSLAAARVRVVNNLLRNATGSAIAEGSLSDNNLIIGNHIKTGGITKSGASTIIRNNLAYTTENYGIATIASGGTSITVASGLSANVANVQLAGDHAETAGAYVSSKSGTNFTIAVAVATTGARTVEWAART